MSDYSEQLTPPFEGDNSMDVTPEMALCDAVRLIRSGKFNAGAAFIILLDNEEGKYTTSYFNSGLKISEAIALLEVEKSNLLEDIRTVEKPDEGENWKDK